MAPITAIAATARRTRLERTLCLGLPLVSATPRTGRGGPGRSVAGTDGPSTQMPVRFGRGPATGTYDAPHDGDGDGDDRAAGDHPVVSRRGPLDQPVEGALRRGHHHGALHR